MNLKELVQQRQNIQSDIIRCLDDEVVAIKQSAETMIEYATNIKGHGYSEFMRARNEFLSLIDELHSQLEASATINTNNHH